MRIRLVALTAALLLFFGVAHPAGATTPVVGTGTITVARHSTDRCSTRQQRLHQFAADIA